MSTRTETENIRASGAEKVLAGVLAIFMLIGGVWAYSQIGKISEETYEDEYGMYFQPVEISTEDRAALREANQARSEHWKTNRQVKRAKEQVQFTGDTYRTEIDAGLPGASELAAYRAAQRNLNEARRAVRTARQAAADAAPAAEVARENRNQARRDAETNQRSDDRWVAILRVLLIAALLAAGVYSLSICRRSRSRLMPLALASVVAGALLAAWMAIDYGTTLGAFREVGPLLISLIGILLTVIAFIALQRYLAKKIPARRVRRKECPFCGYPGHGKAHCEGCGRKIVGECSTCRQARRIASAHCGNCGAT